MVGWLGFDPGLVAELRTRSGYLAALDKHWADLIDRRRGSDGWPRVFCGYEKLPESGIAGSLGLTDGPVGAQLYSSDTCSGARTPIPRKHTELPKPETALDDAHKLLRRAMGEALRDLATRRYRPTRRETLYDSLVALAEASQSPSARDRATG